VRVTPLAASAAANVPLDWSHWAAILAIMIASGTLMLRRRRPS
jgi:hypothetical protein